MPSLFSADGIRAWRAHLDASDTFRDAAAEWVGTIVMLMRDEPPKRTLVRIDRGRIDAAREADEGDEAHADFVLAADAETWERLTSGRTSPTMAAMQGKLSLLKGDLFALIPHAKAAAELLAAGGAASAP